MELNTEGELNTNGASNSGGGNGVKILDFSALADGAALPSEITFTTGDGEILGGGLKPTDTSSGGGDYFEVDSLADGKFVARMFTDSAAAQTSSFIGVRFRISDPDNYHILMWQSKDNPIARIGKFVNGSSTYTTVDAVVAGSNAKPVILVVANGQNIKGYIGDERNITDITDPTDSGFTLVANINDTFNQTATKAGMRLGYTGYRVSEFRYASEQGGGTEQTPPTAAADGDKQDLVAGSPVTMDFSGSSAVAPATIASYNVTQVSGDAVTLMGSGNSRSYTAPSESFAQDLVFQLIVTDSDGLNSSPVTFTHSILAAAQEPVNQPPTANAGPDQSVAAATQFTLDGTGSQDTDGTIIEYRWTQTAGDTVTLDLENPARPTATSPSKTTAQRLTFQLVTVDDENVVSSPSLVNIDVAAVVQNDVLNIIDKISFTFESDGMITAFPGRANRETFRLKPSDPTGLVLEDGWFDFEANDVRRVEISMLETTGVKIISTDTDSITRERSKLHVRMGDMPIKSSTKEFEPTVSVFVGDDERGVVMTAPGLSGAPKVKYYSTTARAV